jgi:putative AlgH/UPF0301 family transcriptional regulator
MRNAALLLAACLLHCSQGFAPPSRAPVAKLAVSRQLHTARCLQVTPVEGMDAGCVIAASADDYGHFTQKSVALVFEYNTEATKAVVIDKPSAFTIGEMTSMDMGALAGNRLYRGGEDGGSAVIMIHKRNLPGAQRIGDSNLFVGGLQAAKAAVTAGQAGAGEFKFFFNFMRWSPGGLEEQVNRGKWHTVLLPDDAITNQSPRADEELW